MSYDDRTCAACIRGDCGQCDGCTHRCTKPEHRTTPKSNFAFEVPGTNPEVTNHEEIARLRRVYRETLAVEAEYLDAMRQSVLRGVTPHDTLTDWRFAVARTHAAENAWLEAKRSRPGKP